MRRVTLTAGSPAHRVTRIAIALVVAVVLFVLPQAIGSTAQIDMLSQMAAYSVAILGLSILTGFCGQISIGHSAFVGLGAYTTVILVADHHWSYLATIPVSIVLCLIAGAIVGVPALRISGLYLATVTLAIAAVFPVLVDKFDGLTGGTNGKFAVGAMTAPSWFFVDTNTRVGPSIFHYYVIVAIAALMFLLARNIVRSRVGRALVAIRDSPYSATAAGVHAARYKVFAFAVSAAFAGVAGSLLMIQLPQATDGRFDLYMSIFLVIGLIAGGRATLAGAIPGAAIFVLLRTYLPDWLDNLHLLGNGPAGGQIVGVVSGIGLIAFAFLLPDGVVDGLRRALGRRVQVVRQPPAGWERYRRAPVAAPASLEHSLPVEKALVSSSGFPDGDKKGSEV